MYFYIFQTLGVLMVAVFFSNVCRNFVLNSIAFVCRRRQSS